MNARQLESIILGVCAIIASVGCSSADLKQALADPPYPVFDAVRTGGVPGGSIIRVTSAISSDIQIVVYPGDEVALDYISTGWGIDEESAAAEAHDKIDVDLNVVTLATQLKEITIDAKFDDEQSPHNSKDSLTLHIRVPPKVRISVDALQAARSTLLVLGEVEYVDAKIRKGDITVQGAVGDLRLSTQQGSIHADERGMRPDQTNQVDLWAHQGNVTLFSVGAAVKARADNGTVHFVGALAGRENSFTATGSGDIVIAVPEDVPYDFYAEGGSRVVTDFMSRTLVCGFIDGDGKQIDESFRTSPDMIGHVDVTRLITQTDYVRGTMERERYVFHTNRGAVTKYLPTVNGQAVGGRTLLPDVPRCQEAVKPGSVRFNATAQKGVVYVRLIRRPGDK